MMELPLGLLLLLMPIAFVSGMGITMIGPGGIFVTIALYSLTPLSAGEIAGTTHAMFVGTGIVGSAAYLRSGELRTGVGRRMAVLLSISSLIGAVAGASLNAWLPRALFGALLGGIAAAIGLLILFRESRGFAPLVRVEPESARGKGILVTVGFAVGVASGLLGIGGPVLAVPILVLIGVPMLLAVAVAQVQSVFIATFAALSYAFQGTVLPVLAVVIGVPLLMGVILGWRVAHLTHPRRLKLALGIVLLVLGPYLMLWAA